MTGLRRANDVYTLICDEPDSLQGVPVGDPGPATWTACRRRRRDQRFEQCPEPVIDQSPRRGRNPRRHDPRRSATAASTSCSDTRQGSETRSKQIAPRLVVGIIAANLSLAVVGLAVGFANAVSGALLGQGVDSGSTTGVLRTLVLAPLAAGGSFLLLMGLVVAVLALLLVGTHLIRVALLVVLVVAGPLVLACHALPYTEGAAQLWWRALAGALATQVSQSLVLITAVRVFFASGGNAALGLSASGALVNVLLACALLYVLVKIPSWIARLVLGGRRGTSTVQLVKTAVVYRTVRTGMAAL